MDDSTQYLSLLSTKKVTLRMKNKEVQELAIQDIDWILATVTYYSMKSDEQCQLEEGGYSTVVATISVL